MPENEMPSAGHAGGLVPKGLLRALADVPEPQRLLRAWETKSRGCSVHLESARPEGLNSEGASPSPVLCLNRRGCTAPGTWEVP